MDQVVEALERVLGVLPLPRASRLQESPEFRAVCDAVARNESVAARLGTTATLPGGSATSLSPEAVTTTLIERLLRRMPIYQSSLFHCSREDAIYDIVSDLHDSLQADNVQHVCSAVMQGCTAERVIEDLAIGNVVGSIRPIAFDEIEYMLAARPGFDREVMFGVLVAEMRWEGEVQYRRASAQNGQRSLQDLPAELPGHIAHLTHCLRVLNYPHPPEVLGFVRYWDHFLWRDSFEPWGIINRTAERGALYSYAFGSWNTVQGISEWSHAPMEPHVVNESIVSDLRRLLQSGKSIRTAVRRLSTALARPHPEDMLVDLAVVLENALQQVDVSRLGHMATADRLALAAAALMRNDPNPELTPRRAFEVIAALHRRRNKAVHGSLSSASVGVEDVRVARQVLLSCAKGVEVPTRGADLAQYLLGLLESGSD